MHELVAEPLKFWGCVWQKIWCGQDVHFFPTLVLQSSSRRKKKIYCFMLP